MGFSPWGATLEDRKCPEKVTVDSKKGNAAIPNFSPRFATFAFRKVYAFSFF
jgi:hypothetical protein